LEYYVNNQIIPAALRVLSVLNVNESQLGSEGKKTSLADFA
jgi:DNA polymerase elongation subunit (family B)